MAFERLLAKSRPKELPPGKALPQSACLHVHLGDVHRAAAQVLAATADDQLQALGLKGPTWSERLHRIVLLAAACHDLGKANDHFQGMVQEHTERAGRPQGLRHEWVSLLMLEQPELRAWLMPAVAGNDTDWEIMLWAVAGHHPAYHRPSPPRLFVDGAGHEMALLMGHRDFVACLEWLGRAFALAAPSPTPSRMLSLAGAANAFATRILPWFARARSKWDELTDDDRRLVAAVKACLIAGDVAGSALPREVPDEAARATWIARAFGQVPPPGRIQGIVDRRRGTNPLYPFQQAVAASPVPVTFIRAGCGSGKTLAAYQWAAAQHPGRRLYFCYPTTGTATEGYRDYLYAPEEDFDAELFHGRAAVDLEMVLGVKADDDRPEADDAARIESLDAWSTPIVACTVDTVLGLMQNNRRGLYAWPALAGAAFVFDEIHSYDDKLFGALLRFLQTLPAVPALLMTASLPTARLHALQEVLASRQLELPIIPSRPLPSELWKRYHRQGPVDTRDPLPEVREELARGGKVLWVCNTVDRAIAAAEAAKDAKPKIYHSRFRYEDRVQRHKEVVAAFDLKTTGPTLACCTQVAEMSLDLKGVTLLVTELAPVPSLIQRLGRLNRQATAESLTRPFVVIVPEGELPYTAAGLDGARAWLTALGEGPLSQDHLAKAWEDFDKDQRPPFVAAAWLDGGPATQVLELREASPGITVVLQRDGVAVRTGRLHPARAALPMPPPPRPWRNQWRQWPQAKGLPVAPTEAIAYDPQRGAQWQK
jgi:CRISPR-associated endonuclease/helicase Cas3